MRNPQETAETGHETPVDYVDRVNRAIDFVLGNLQRQFNLSDMADAACFSPFHFHRIFRGIVGETPSQFVKRLRLERALTKMAHDPRRSLTEIALDCGFSSSSDFSRSFKRRYSTPPSAFDMGAYRASKRGELQMLVEQSAQNLRVERLPEGENPDGFSVRIRSLPARTMAYLRVLDPYREHVVVDAATRLEEWARLHGVADNPWYGYMWDDPEVVELKDCRYDVAVEADGFEPDGGIGRFEFPPMRVAQIEIRGAIDLEMRALDWVYRTWLPTSRYVPDDLPCFEAWIGRPFAHGVEHFELYLQLPIRKV